jgi:flagellar capping protein FliD
LKEHLTDLLNQNIEGIIQLIKFSIKLESEQVEEYISSVMSKLESRPKNM